MNQSLIVRQFRTLFLISLAHEEPGIVITDLDGFAESDEESDLPNKEFEVHPRFLEQIRSRKLNNRVPPLAGSSQALILFRPPPLLPASIEENEPSPTPAIDEYAMDLDG
jgi:hypothetical protein